MLYVCCMYACMLHLFILCMYFEVYVYVSLIRTRRVYYAVLLVTCEADVFQQAPGTHFLFSALNAAPFCLQIIRTCDCVCVCVVGGWVCYFPPICPGHDSSLYLFGVRGHTRGKSVAHNFFFFLPSFFGGHRKGSVQKMFFLLSRECPSLNPRR